MEIIMVILIVTLVASVGVTSHEIETESKKQIEAEYQKRISIKDQYIAQLKAREK